MNQWTRLDSTSVICVKRSNRIKSSIFITNAYQHIQFNWIQIDIFTDIYLNKNQFEQLIWVSYWIEILIIFDNTCMTIIQFEQLTFVAYTPTYADSALNHLHRTKYKCRTFSWLCDAVIFNQYLLIEVQAS